MREDTGLPERHDIKYEDIRDTRLKDENMLKSQNIELTRHINALEACRLKLTKQLIHNTYQMGEIGIRFLELL